MATRILIVDDEVSLRKVLAASLRREGYEVASAKDADEALQLFSSAEAPETGDPFHLVISDLKMPGSMNGMELLRALHKRRSDLPVVMLTAHGTVDLAVQALKEGAFDFVTKPYERDAFLATVKKAVEQGRRNAEEPSPEAAGASKKLLIGESDKMQEVQDVIERVADTPSTVLVTGESGTGKELVAAALHDGSRRKDRPFIRINCGAIPPTLIEAELFGYEKGAFTGAVTSKPGRFELAHEGTLFLDEIGDLPIDMQVKLLRVLQEGTFERVGGVTTHDVDVRLIAATNKDLEAAIEAGEFREDLFYRLNVVPIALPPLRERTADIPALVSHFLARFNDRLGKKVEKLTPSAMQTLAAYHWPGNIRELENIIERTLLFSDDAVIDKHDLPPELIAKVEGNHGEDNLTDAFLEGTDADASMKEIVRHATARIERDLILRALEETGGNVTHAARRLKISRKSLQVKMKELGLRDDPSPKSDHDSHDGPPEDA